MSSIEYRIVRRMENERPRFLLTALGGSSHHKKMHFMLISAPRSKSLRFAPSAFLLGFLVLASSACSTGDSSEVECSAAGVTVSAPYKGIWAPALLSGMQSIDEPAEVKALGGNLASIVFEAQVSSEGEVSARSSWQSLGEMIDLYHSGGVAVVLSLDSQMEGGSAESPVMDSTLVSSTTFQESLTAITLELAGVAEKCGVAIFAPYNEADLKMGGSAAGTWGQEILPKVREVYSGKVLWKLANASNTATVDVTGYDMAGFSASPGGTDTASSFQARVLQDAQTAKAAFAAKGLTSFWVSEYGVWGGFDSGKTDAEIATYFDAVPAALEGLGFEGFMALDGPEGYDPQLSGTPAGTSVQNFFSR